MMMIKQLYFNINRCLSLRYTIHVIITFQTQYRFEIIVFINVEPVEGAYTKLIQ